MAHNHTFRVVTDGTVTVQQQRAKAARLPKTDLRYWEAAVYHRTYTRNEERFHVSHYSARIQHQGRQEIFALQTGNKAAAAGRAREVYLYLLANGWEATNALYKPTREQQTCRNSVRTIGELIAQIKAHNHSTGRTLDEYIRNLRRLVAGVFGIDGGKAKYDYRKGGRDEWLSHIDAIALESLTPALIQKWKTDYLSRAGRNPAKQRAAKISVNSIIRGARSLFASRYIEHLQLLESFRHPFGGVKLERRQSMRYQSKFDLEKLIRKGLAELTDNDPEVLKALLLGAMAGLRRKEIDMLPWSAFDWQRNTLRIAVTDHFAAKSEDSIGEVDLDPELVGLFQGYHAKRKGDFVIDSHAQPNLRATYAHYRCAGIFDRAVAWLRNNGVAGQRPLHTLRKEFGSRICTRHGLFAASRALRHADISTTASHYLDKQKQTCVGLGHLLVPPRNGTEAFDTVNVQIR